ncbi:hypothetical protein ROLI_037610 [Roseobacter fucihabitans]|uniref:3-deoxy-D-manno-octulosonic acid transferase n=1 Tax=Roseobacter fucihabitans TaxID=1537242 RepID=A0ABZ2BX69_9RHOB|nr:glycosyltransferase N-terminal domain-containing protein [Roseobacter litoralis]MBC6967826.1 3-deoxy-D-manno-octulosonic acid transferase [Roseobacter litoralis]
MGHSLGLAAYRALTHRSAKRSFTPNGTRPKGELVWIHAAEPSNLLALQDLAERLCTTRDGLSILITLPDRETLDRADAIHPQHPMIVKEEIPSEHPAAVQAFLAHWMPDMCIWTWGQLRPNLLLAAYDAKCPMVLIDADKDGFDGQRDRWLPDLSRDLLTNFTAVMSRSPQAVQRLEALGLKSRHIQMTPPLQAGGQALPCKDSIFSAMTSSLAGRPVWLATRVQEHEAGIILAAHRQALRYSHRLLLILHPAERHLAPLFTDKAEAEGFRVCDWVNDGDPTEATQVMLAEDGSDLGLFYRLAPVSFLGSSLVSGYGGCNPFEAAALGSAVLYGPNVRRYLPFYTRLANAGAARIVNDTHSLGTAVTRLIAPDQAATMAHAGWDVISSGAELVDKVIDLVETTLDHRLEPSNAHP